MKSTFYIITAFCVTLLTTGQRVTAQETNTAPEIITLSLPKGQKMDFVLVRVTEAESPFSSVSFHLGKDLNAEYNERLASTSVAGTVYVPEHDGRKAYWAIPIARTEVTRAQYAAVMTPEKMPTEDEAQIPCTNVSYVEIQEFIAKLNAWCLSDSHSEAAKTLQKLAISGMHGVPYIRLPMENEWEFAARGGGHVSPEQLEEDFPYSSRGHLYRGENLSGKGNEKLQPVNYKTSEHPCGLCHMFGNVREMVDGVFRPEYHFGRAGGLIVRGGAYDTSFEDISSYTRIEVEPFNARGEIYRSPTVGFRLAMGSTIVSKLVKGPRLIDMWNEYLEKLVQVSTPGSSPTDSLEKALAEERETLAKQLQEMARQMAAFTGKTDSTGDLSALENTLKNMSDQMKEMEKKIRQSQVTSAQAALMMLYFASADAAENIAATQLERERANISGISEETRQVFLNNIKMLEENIAVYWAIFSKGCKVLKDVTPSVVEAEIQTRMKELRAAGSENDAARVQIAILEIAIKHFKKYVSSGRLSDEECMNWYHELEIL